MNNWLKQYYKNNLKIFVDISTYCNAACPQCHRTDLNGLGKVDWLPLIRWSIDEFKSAYSEELVKSIHEWEVTCTWGDPMMCKDLYEICEYILQTNPYTRLTVDTNGSIRPLSWWKKLGELSKLVKEGPCDVRESGWKAGLFRVDFAIEGITQEMQAKYRRKTELAKILANMKAFTEAGGDAAAFCVVQKHNQDHLYEIKKMAHTYGAKIVWFVESNRYNDGPKFHFVNEDGEEEYLEQVNGDYFKPSAVTGVISDWKTRTEYQPKTPKWLLDMQNKVNEIGEEQDIH